jgi:hypothetical protein
MGDEGGGVAVLGGDIDLLVDHGRFFSLLGSALLASATDTIARKPWHDKATGRVMRPRRT